MTAERTGKSEQMYVDLGNCIFTEANQMLRKPKSLIIKLKGIGQWHLRRKRMQIVVSEFKDGLVDEFTSPQTLLEWKERRDRYEMFVERLKEYDDFISMRNEVRKKRYVTQKLIEPPKREDNSS